MNANNSMSFANLENLIKATSEDKNAIAKSPYSQQAKRFKLDVKGLEVLLPFYDEFNAFSSSFIATVNTEVVIEFNDFVRLIRRHPAQGESLKPFNRDIILSGHLPSSVYPFLYSEFNLETISKLLVELFDSVDKDILLATKSLGKTPDAVEVFDYYSHTTKQKLQQILTHNLNELNHIFLVYIMNITLLNIKSMILTGAEIINSKKDRLNVAVMPKKFIPKLGTHFSTLPLSPTHNYLSFYKLITQSGSGSGKINLLKLDKNKTQELLNLTVKETNVDLFEISEYFGLSRELFDAATLQVLNIAVNIDVGESEYRRSETQNFEAVRTVTDSLDTATEFINSFEEFIDSMSVLVSEFRSLFKYEGLHIVDID